jgi:WD40 repeat protein/biotin carboxyl carrier protein
MFRLLTIAAALCLVVFVVVTWQSGETPWGANASQASEAGNRHEPKQEVKARPGLVARQANFEPQQPPPGAPRVNVGAVLVQGARGNVPIIVPEGRLVSVETVEVPSRRNGELLVIGHDLPLGTKYDPKDRRLISLSVGILAMKLTEEELRAGMPGVVLVPGDTAKYRRWELNDGFRPETIRQTNEQRVYKLLEVGHKVEKGQLLAVIDPALAWDDLGTKIAKTDANEAGRRAADLTAKEAGRRYETDRALALKGVVSKDQEQASFLTWQRYVEEEVEKRMAVMVGKQEANAAYTVVKMHEIRAPISGVVKEIYKKRGEAVKELEQVMRIYNPDLLRVEGMIEVQYAQDLVEDQPVTIEPTMPEGPNRVIRGHLQPVNAVAMTRHENPLVVSGSEDATARVWNTSGEELWTLQHPAAVKSLATAPVAAKHNLCLTGCSDGSLRLWNLDDLAKDQPRDVPSRHRGPVLSVAFNADGTLFATAGDDRSICIWKLTENNEGDLVHQIANAHKGPVTWVQFTAAGDLVSAGRDYTLSVWSLKNGSAPSRIQEIDRRSGDVAQFGLTHDGTRVLYDQGKELRILKLADKKSVGAIQNPTGSANFTNVALFSPDSQMVLTSSDADGRLQLWKTPAEGVSRATELRQYVWTGLRATCAAFAPRAPYVVTGSKEHVLLWKLPSAQEIQQEITGNISLIERSLDSSSRQVRIWAQFDNSKLGLKPGGTATLVIKPKP